MLFANYSSMVVLMEPLSHNGKMCFVNQMSDCLNLKTKNENGTKRRENESSHFHYSIECAAPMKLNSFVYTYSIFSANIVYIASWDERENGVCVIVADCLIMWINVQRWFDSVTLSHHAYRSKRIWRGDRTARHTNMFI